MNDELEDMEASLRSLSPRRPSSRVWEAIQPRLSEPVHTAASGEETFTSGPSPWRLWFPPVGLAAACLALLLLWPRNDEIQGHRLSNDERVSRAEATARTEAPPRLMPVAAEAILCSSEDEGIVSLSNGRTARKLRREYLDIYTWRDPKTNASLRWVMPREEVRVIPVSAY